MEKKKFVFLKKKKLKMWKCVGLLSNSVFSQHMENEFLDCDLDRK
jgi:hypothetical protein